MVAIFCGVPEKSTDAVECRGRIGHLDERRKADAPVDAFVTQSCLLGVSERSVLEALQSGAAKVLFAACDPATCRFPHAEELVAKRAERIRSLLAQLGMEDAFEVVPVEPLEGDYLPWSS